MWVYFNIKIIKGRVSNMENMVIDVKKAEAILKEVKANPDNFEKIAEQNCKVIPIYANLLLSE